jgi:tetratricopeptide (TPR) repeat protein
MNKYRILIIVILNLVVVNCFAQNEVNKRMYKTAIKQMNAGKYEDATHKFLQYYEQNKNVKKIFPKGRVNNAAFYLGIIKFYHLDYVGANIWFQKVQSRTDFYYYPAFEYLIKSGKAYSEGDFDKAIQYSTMSITKKPKKNYDAYLIRAKSYIAKDNSAKAQKDFDFIIKNGKKSPAKAFALLFTGELRSAVKLMKKLLRKDKKKEYYYNMASIYSYLNSKELALENLEKSIKNGHKYPYYFWKTKDLEEIRDSEEFLNLMQKYNIEKPVVLKSEELEKEMLAFEKTLKTGTVELCNNFIANYPDSSKIDTVTYFKNELIAWQISKNDPTREKV